MLRIVILLAAACVLIFAVLAFVTHRPQHMETATQAASTALQVVTQAPPTPVAAPAQTTAAVSPPAPALTQPEEAQMADDAAAAGMATREPAADATDSAARSPPATAGPSN
jgi:hypothetical protein